MKALLVFLGVIVTAAISGSSALACSCMPTPPPAATLVHTTAVFVGEVRAIEALPDRRGSRIAFAVLPDGAIKGVSAGTEVLVFTLPTAGQCGFPFQEGVEYLVYATGELDHLHTTVCSRTRVYRRGGVVDADAAAELAILRRAVDTSTEPAPAGKSPDARAHNGSEPAANPAGPPPATTPDKRGCAGCASSGLQNTALAGVLLLLAGLSIRLRGRRSK